MNIRTSHMIALASALIVGAFAHQLIQAESAALGLSVLELALLTGAAGAFASRTMPALKG